MTFDEIYQPFTKTIYWHQMLSTQENSPYHREANVAVHTQMALSFYKEHFFLNRNENERLLSQLAILFHDIGKPMSQVEKFTEKRGLHNSYAGHELVSSRLFENYALSNNICLTDLQIRQVKWMIENHLPYGRKSYVDFRIDATRALTGNFRMFADVLFSDAGGRITEQSKIPTVTKWVEEELYLQNEDKEHFGKKDAYILVGPSGSGKSTVTNKLLAQDNNLVIFSLDTLRIKYFKMNNKDFDQTLSDIDLYSLAFKYSVDNKEAFNEYTKKQFLNLIIAKNNIIIDNTNLSPKTRRQWITLLKQHDYNVIGFEFMSNLDLLEQRAKTRNDKQLKFEIVKNQYFAQQLLRYSEVDSIRIINNNRENK